MNLMTYKEVLDHLKKNRRKKHLLLGNGFSMSYDKKIFSYNALSSFIENTSNPLLKHLFSIVNTSNFEQVMRQLEIFYKLAAEFQKDKKLADMLVEASNALKSSLIDAVSGLHPEHVYKIPEDKAHSCAKFLIEYTQDEGQIFSTNYDLLLYWVFMTNMASFKNVVDGFGREYIESDEYKEPEFGDLEWGPNRAQQQVHYLHGALHLFDTGIAIEKEVYDGDYLLKNVEKRLNNKEYPIFVTAGDGNQKLENILHNQYLDYCYKSLCEISGSLITFGFAFGSYDHHIIEAINKAVKQDIDKKLWSVYIGVFSEEDIKNIESIKHLFKCKVKLFDAKTVNVWGDSND